MGDNGIVDKRKGGNFFETITLQWILWNNNGQFIEYVSEKGRIYKRIENKEIFLTKTFISIAYLRP